MTSRDDSDAYYGTGTPGELTCPDCGDLLAWSGWRETCPSCDEARRAERKGPPPEDEDTVEGRLNRNLAAMADEIRSYGKRAALRRAEDVCQQTRTAEGQGKPTSHDE